MHPRRHVLSLALALLCAVPATGIAQTYPSRPVRLVVSFAAGGPTDAIARIVAMGMTKALGQQVIVDNRAGGGGMLGTKEASKAPADGYTLLFAGDAALTVQPQLSKNAGYDAQKDFTPLRLVASQVNVLVASSAKNLPNVATLISRAKAEPGKLFFGSAGNGSPSHLIGELFKTNTGTDLTHVPYKGAAPAMTDLIGGQTDLMFVGMPVALQNEVRKELKLLAVTGAKRSPSLPNIPTFAELGIQGLGAESSVWWAVMGPPGLTPAVQARLDAALQSALTDAEVSKALASQGVDVLNLDAKTTAQWITRDYLKWGKLIKTNQITAD